jgi:hypothetical protein
MGVTKQDSRTTTGKKRDNAKGQLIDVRPDGELATGRPTKYDPKYDDAKVIEMGREGKSLAQMMRELDISAQCMHEWRAKHTSFGKAVDHAILLAQAFWEAELEKSVSIPPKFHNTKSLIFLMRNRFKDYRASEVPKADDTLPAYKGPNPEDYTNEELLAILQAEGAKRRASRS